MIIDQFPSFIQAFEANKAKMEEALKVDDLETVRVSLGKMNAIFDVIYRSVQLDTAIKNDKDEKEEEK